ncbi:MAG: rod shape-determining protein MreD [Elusimicrobia bacterium]|nr:rod shape-determining protein MreD [Elusimicrobiota bacterium]
MTPIIRIPLFFVLAMLAHWWWTTHFTFSGIAPQLLLVLTLAIAARYGPIRAMCMGFGWGLFLDTMSAHLFGANALALTLAGYSTGSIRRWVDVAGLPSQCLLVFAMTWIYFLFLGVLGALFMKQFLWVGWLPFLADPLYNCLAAAAVSVSWMDYK